MKLINPDIAHIAGRPLRIHYVSGSRADFGLMRRTLKTLASQQGLEVSVVVTGQHLSRQYGLTVREIEATGLSIVAQIPVKLSGESGLQMGTALATELLGFLDTWSSNRPDLVLVLGDRGEMVAAALAAVHLGIHVAHIHGGELSGTLDESFRHVLTKLAHFHFAATLDAARRISRLGEREDRIWVVGAPGLVGLEEVSNSNLESFAERFQLERNARCYALVIFHPVVQEAASAAIQMQAVLDALDATDCASVLLRPNSDSGGSSIERLLDQQRLTTRLRIVGHLDRASYLGALKDADLIIGNSSSGIIESASLGTPCVNLGTRQAGRLRNGNTIDCVDFDTAQIVEAIERARRMKGPFRNVYGDGTTDVHLANLIPSLPLSNAVLAKANSY